VPGEGYVWRGTRNVSLADLLAARDDARIGGWQIKSRLESRSSSVRCRRATAPGRAAERQRPVAVGWPAGSTSAWRRNGSQDGVRTA